MRGYDGCFFGWCEHSYKQLYQDARKGQGKHTIFPTVLGLLEWMNYSNEELKGDLFQSQVLMDNEALIKAYKGANDKKWVKGGLVNAIGAGRVQLLKNWGIFERDVGAKEWNLTIDEHGDVFRKEQLSFYAICSVLDPRSRDLQLPPARSLFFEAFPWKIDDERKGQVYDQLVIYLKDPALALPDDGDLNLFWESLEQKSRAKYGKLARFALRCLSVPGSSAEVERAVSSYNNIVTNDRVRLSDDCARDYVTVYTNNPDRKEKNAKRSESMRKAQKKRQREYELDFKAFKPRKKAAAEDD